MPDRDQTPAHLLPPDFRARVHGMLGAEADAFFAALTAPAAGLRVNTLRLPPERFRELAPFALEPLAFPTAGFLVGEGERPGRHPYHAAGLYYLQDPGAMTVAALVAPRPGERVLDLAAAPGGKATHLAALLGGEGLLVANDVHAGRARELAGNLERCGVRNALVTNESAERLADHFGAWFDRVLLDAPCSGESMFHKSEAAREEWSPAAVLGCARRQGDLLETAARLVRPGGVLVYSTCTFSPEENEGVVAGFLAAHPEFAAAALDAVPGAEPGRPEWAASGERSAGLARTLRLWPHRVPGAGHFVAALRRHEGEEGHPARRPEPPVPRGARAVFADFRGEHLRLDPLDDGVPALFGDELYALPPESPGLGRLRVVRPGWWLGTVHRDRFEPSHTLAMTLPPAGAARVLELSADAPEALAYLRGESLAAPGERGWTLVAVDGFALGWGKRVGDTVKNHYPKGLRWRRGVG